MSNPDNKAARRNSASLIGMRLNEFTRQAPRICPVSMATRWFPNCDVDMALCEQMSRIYELIEAMQPLSYDGRTVWRAYADDYSSPECLSELIRAGFVNHATSIRRLYAAGDYHGVVKVFDDAFEIQIRREAADGSEWAKEWLQCLSDKEVLFDLLRKYGVERTGELIQLNLEHEKLLRVRCHHR